MWVPEIDSVDLLNGASAKAAAASRRPEKHHFELRKAGRGSHRVLFSPRNDPSQCCAERQPGIEREFSHPEPGRVEAWTQGCHITKKGGGGGHYTIPNCNTPVSHSPHFPTAFPFHPLENCRSLRKHFTNNCKTITIIKQKHTGKRNNYTLFTLTFNRNQDSPGKGC